MATSHGASPFLHDHIALTVKDLAVSREFYEYLGGRVVSKPSSGFMEIVLGEIRLHILPSEGDSTDVAPASRIDHLCLRVASLEDLASVHERIRAHPLIDGHKFAIEDSPPLGEGGAEHCEERPPQKTLYFEDPDGIRLEVRAYS